MQERIMYDIVIRGGSIVDGTGAGPVRGDLAIADGRIVAIGQVEGETRETIDASGQIVCPDLSTCTPTWMPRLGGIRI